MLRLIRCSNHKLAIEQGRHNAINLENRLCKFCDSIQVCVIEDEFQFLLIYPMRYYFRNVITDCTFNKFLELMCSNNISVLLTISLFVKHGMKKRHEWRNMHYLFQTVRMCYLIMYFGLRSCRRNKQHYNTSIPRKHETFIQGWFKVGPPSTTADQHCANLGSTSRRRVYWVAVFQPFCLSLKEEHSPEK